MYIRSKQCIVLNRRLLQWPVYNVSITNIIANFLDNIHTDFYFVKHVVFYIIFLIRS